MIQSLWHRWRDEQERLDYRVGMLASVIANVSPNTKKHGRAYKPEDFMRYVVKRKPRQMTVTETVNYVAMLNAALGGVDLRPNKAVA